MAIWGPIAAQAFRFDLELVYILPFCLPQPKVYIGARSQRLEHWIEAKRLNFGGVGVFQQADTLRGPHDDIVVSTG